MSDDRVSYRDLTRQFLQNIMQGEHDDSVKQDNLLVEAKKKAKKKSKKKEPDYGDGAYFVGAEVSDVKAREDAWAGGDNVFSDVDYVKAAGAPLDPRSEDRVMSITELRSIIDREMRSIFETKTERRDSWPDLLSDMYSHLDSRGEKMWPPTKIISTLMKDVYSDEGRDLQGEFERYVDDSRHVMQNMTADPDGHILSRWLQRRDDDEPGSAFDELEMAQKAAWESDPTDDPEDMELSQEDLPTEEVPLPEPTEPFPHSISSQWE